MDVKDNVSTELGSSHNATMEAGPGRKYQSNQVLERAAWTVGGVPRTQHFFGTDYIESTNCVAHWPTLAAEADKPRSHIRRAVLKGDDKKAERRMQGGSSSGGRSACFCRVGSALRVSVEEDICFATADFGLGQGALPCRVLVRVLGSTVDIAAGTVRHHPTADVTTAQCQSLFQRLVGAPYRPP